MSQKFHEVFKPGVYPQGNFPASFVQAVAANYDPKFCDAPITTDHQDKGPAYGWIEAAKFEGEKLMVAFRDVDENLKKLVDAGKMNKVSVEFFMDLPGKGPYLKAVTFLGAAIPQVKGLEPVKFKDGDSKTVVFEMEVNLADENAELKRQLAEAKTREEQAVAKFAQAETDKAAAVAETTRINLAARKNEFETFVNQLIASGNFRPAKKASALALFASLDSVAKFSDGQVPVEVFKDVLKDYPKFLELDSEHATHDKHDPITADTAEFGDANVDTERMDMHSKAVKLAAKEKISYPDAIIKIRKEGK